MEDLADRTCEPCRGGVDRLAIEDVERFLREIPGWQAPGHHHLVRRWERADFAASLALVQRFAELAEEQDHHPELAFGWGWVEAKIWTHKIDGLSLADFVLAAKFARAAV